MIAIRKVIQEENTSHVKTTTQSYKDETKKEITKVYKDVFAIDIGFGYEKFKATDTEGTIASFCSQIGSLQELVQTEKQEIINSLTIEHNGQIQLVGFLAAKHDRQVARSTYRERALDDNFQVLFKAGIVAAYHRYSNVDLTVVTGLPNDDLNNQKDDLAEKIRGITTVNYYYDNKRYTINITYSDVIVVTQPEGFRAELLFNDNFNHNAPINEQGDVIRRMGVLDFGHGTLNMSLFEGTDILGVGTRTCSAAGLHSIYDTVGMALKKYFDQFDSNHLDIECAIVRKKVRVRGRQYDVSDLVNPIVDKYANDSFQAIYEKWKGELDQLNAIFITGGGSNIIAERIAHIFAKKARYTDVYIVDLAQLLNVRGYYKIGYGC